MAYHCLSPTLLCIDKVNKHSVGTESKLNFKNQYSSEYMLSLSEDAVKF